MISQEELKELIIYDPLTGLFYRKNNPTVPIGSLHTKGYWKVSVKNKLYYAHRLAWFYVYGYFPKNQIDHINLNKLDNRIANLRECTNAENSQNKRALKNSTSKYVGVSWDKFSKKWKSEICLNGKRMTLGRYATELEAFDAYCKAKRKLHPFGTL